MKQRAFTLVELLVTLVVTGVIVTLAAPAFGEIISSQRRQDTAQQLASGIRTARTEAILRGQPVVIRAIESNWSNGWQIVVDPKNSENDLVLVERARSGKVPVTGNRPVRRSIRFDALGVPTVGGSFLAGTLFICDTKAAVSHYTVVMARTGRVRIEREVKPQQLCG